MLVYVLIVCAEVLSSTSCSPHCVVNSRCHCDLAVVFGHVLTVVQSECCADISAGVTAHSFSGGLAAKPWT